MNSDRSRFHIADFDSNTTFVRVQTNFDIGPPLDAIDYPIPEDAIVKHQFIIPNNNQSNYMSIRVSYGCIFCLIL